MEIAAARAAFAMLVYSCRIDFWDGPPWWLCQSQVAPQFFFDLDAPVAWVAELILL
jgi:hypothetical protein